MSDHRVPKKESVLFPGYVHREPECRITSPEELSEGEMLHRCDRIVVTTFRKSKDIENRLRNLKIPKEKVSFL